MTLAHDAPTPTGWLPGQARLRGWWLRRTLGVPLETSRVHRRRDTAPQASLPWKERKQNIRHAFECHIDLTGKTVLLVDDVMTTGATLGELARILRAHGAARVENLVLARTLKD